MQKQRIAVLFGGRAPEHDVSIVSGLQALHALDSSRFDAFPVYITPGGQWLVGPGLEQRENYLPSAEMLARLTPVQLDICPGKSARLLPPAKGLLRKSEPIEFDIALLAFHGANGEDGALQGLFDFAAIPYTGMRALASALFMDKGATKRALRGLGVPLLPEVIIDRPGTSLVIEKDKLKTLLGDLDFPLCVKPVHLGSSIGVGKAENLDELQALLPPIFQQDHQVILEPFVENLVEYNVAVSKLGGEVRTSAIECPKRSDALLDFKQKYLSGGGGSKKSGAKQPGTTSEGMLSLTRDINPSLPEAQEKLIRGNAALVFQAFGGSGVPRIDFYGNEKTGELWFNELNPCPGSFGYFLWEAAAEPMLFSQLLTALLVEARAKAGMAPSIGDLTPREARLFPRPGE